jgi:hypothetical protein
MRILRFTFFILLMFSLSDRIVAQELDWAFLLGGASTDRANGLMTDGDNNVYVTGGFEGTVDFDPDDSGETSITSNGSIDIYVAKYDSSGDFVWVFGIGNELTNTHGDIGKDIALDSEGNIYITGFVGGDVDFDPSPNEAILTGSGGDDFFIAKYDNDGNYLWAHRGGSNNYEPSTSNSIGIDSNDNVVITGSFNRRITIGSHTLDVGSGNVHAFLAKYSPSGSVLWAIEMGGPGQAEGYTLAYNHANTLYAMGSFTGQSQFGSFTLAGGQYNNVFIVKVDGTGSVQWAKEIVSPGSATGKDLAIDQHENLYVTGDYYQSLDADPGVNAHTLSSNGDSDIFFVSLNAMGSFRWGYSIGGTGVDYIYGLGISPRRQEICITGRFTGELDTDPAENLHTLTSAGAEDAFLSAYSLAGDFRWAVSFEDQDSNTDQGTDVVYDTVGNLICTGSISGSVDFDPQTSLSILSTAGSEDAYIAKLTGLPLYDRISMILNVPTVYSSIQLALGDADSLDIVLVQPGIYYENIIWPEANGIKLISAGDSSNTIIDGGGLSSVIYMNPQTVTIDTTSLIQSFKITNGGNVVSGGGLFLNNASPSLLGLSIESNSATTRGGGIYLGNSNPHLSEVFLSENSCSGDGGGMYLEASNPIMFNTLFLGNSTSGSGGGMYLVTSDPIMTNPSFLGNTSISSGGGMYLNLSSPSITEIIANDNAASEGGGMMIYRGSSPIISGGLITNNSAVWKGGGLELYWDSDATLNGLTISNNTATDGGGLYSSNSDITLSDVLIIGNIAINGSGLYLHSGSPVLTDVTIANNAASGNGGGVHCLNSYAHFTRVIIKKNLSNESGGGVYCSGGWIYLTEATIIKNSASQDGGGMYLIESSSTMSNLTVANNTASHKGGGIQLIDGTNQSITNANIIGNSAAVNGGGLFMDGANPTLSYVNITNNYSATNGEGIHIVSGIATISNSNLINNGSGVFNVDNSNIIDATNNYWGSSLGPYHPIQNPNGNGETTNIYVNVTPWFTIPDVQAPPIPVQNLVISDSGNDFISLSWDFSPLSDFAGFTLHYDTDSSGAPYSLSENIGFDTTFTLSGLPISTEYFFTVTTIDTEGNESWYSNEVVGITRVIEIQDLDFAGDEELHHIISHDPLITFEYFDSMSESQTNYHIQISTDSTFQSNLIWDTGVIASDVTSVQYTEGALLDGVNYYLRAKVASGSYWSQWANFAFGMNTEPSIPAQLSLIGDEVTTSEILLEISNSSDAEEDNLTYDFRLYNATMSVQLDSAIGVVNNPSGTEWEVTAVLVDNSQHWWTVQAFDGYEYSELAGPESFLINFENDDPAGFDLTSPLLDEVVINQSPLFTWDPAIDPDPLDTVRYVLYLETPDPGIETFYPGIDTSFQLTYALEDNTTYHWKVVAHDLHDSETESNVGYQIFTVNTANDLPEYFELLYPVWDEMVTNLQPEFLWEASSDPDDETIVMRSRGKGQIADQYGSGNTVNVITGYDFYLGTDSLLTDIVPVEVIGTSYSQAEDLLENQIYYWVVSAIDDSGGVTFSDTASFWTNAENEAPAEFSLLLPTEGEVLTVLSPTFVWEPSNDPDLYDGFGYHILLGSSPEDMDTLWSGEDITLTSDWELEDNTTYYWSVLAEDWGGLVTHNTDGYQSFTVNTANDLPEYFELLYPVWDEMVTNLQPEFLWEASSDPDDQTIVMRSACKGRFADQSGSGNTVDVITGYDFYLGTDSLLTDVVPVEVFDTYYSPTEDLLENQVYYWAVSAVDDSGGVTFSDTTSFWTNAENEAPAEFSLLLPVAGEVLTALSPTFVWEPSSDPDLYDGFGYHILLGNSPENMDTLWTGEDTTLTIDWELDDNMTYYWAVFAEDWSDVETYNIGGFQSFIVNQGNDDPSMVELITPDSVMVLSLTPEMYWTPASDLDPGDMVSYEMHWWGDGIEYDSVLTDTNAVYLPRELEDNSLYFWNVISMDQNGGISHSEEATFWTDLIPETPLAFALLSPEDDVTGLGQVLTFFWEIAIDPDPLDYATYTFQIATDTAFTNIMYETNTGVDVALELMEILPDENEYWWRVIATDRDSLSTVSETFKFTIGYVSIAEEIALPTEYVLDQNYPNPFNPSTTLRYGLPEDSEVSMVIYDIRGNMVRTIESGAQVAGWYEHVWNGMNNDGQPVSTGLYLTRLRAGSYTKTIQMLYLK